MRLRARDSLAVIGATPGWNTREEFYLNGWADLLADADLREITRNLPLVPLRRVQELLPLLEGEKKESDSEGDASC